LVPLPATAVDINDAGQILTADAVYHLASNGKLIKTTLPTASKLPGIVLSCTAINDDGTIVGVEQVLKSPSRPRYSKPVLIAKDRNGIYRARIVALTNDTVEAVKPVAINNNNEVLMWRYTATNRSTPGAAAMVTFGAKGRISVLDLDAIAPAGYRDVYGPEHPLNVNDAGQIIALAGRESVLMIPGRHNTTLISQFDLAGDESGGNDSFADINAVGEIVGNAVSKPVIYRRNSRGRYYRTTLGSFAEQTSGTATGVSDSGRIIGFALTGYTNYSTRTAFVADPLPDGSYGAPVDLDSVTSNRRNVHIDEPLAINTGGSIIANALDQHFNLESVLLMPADQVGVQRAVAPPQPTAAPYSLSKRINGKSEDNRACAEEFVRSPS
jgi:hypothetical protein